ncbi:MAG: DUF4270 domain-containing protein [Muribaculaceae bacterium]|nr:DUF4270 domain-containing protein [Muribaculaceae bacterium]
MPHNTPRLRGAHTLLLAAPAIIAGCLASCDDDVSKIGSSLSKGETVITVDSLTMKLHARSVYEPEFDSRGTINLIGRLHAAEYGTLECSYVASLIPATSLSIPDSISIERVDSMRVEIIVPRGQLAGDSLAPQQLRVYGLTSPLPADIESNFNPEGYYSPSSLLGSRSYTLSVVGATDSLFRKQTAITIPVRLPREDAVRVVEAYRKDPSTFAWPETFAKFMPGIYVRPSFGMGAVANVSNTRFTLYYHYLTQQAVSNKDEKTGETTVEMVVKKNKVSVPVFSTGPAALNSNNITYTPSPYLGELAASGKAILTTPGGYRVNVTLPMADILKKYADNPSTLKMVNNLSLSIPAREIPNGYGIAPPPYLLLVKRSEAAEFFMDMKVPDGKTSFYASYNSTTGQYAFSSMRDYLVSLISLQSAGTLSEEDMEFQIIPVYITKETYTDYTDYSTKEVVTRCRNYFELPTFCELDTDNAMLVVTYSSQSID